MNDAVKYNLEITFINNFTTYQQVAKLAGRISAAYRPVRIVQVKQTSKIYETDQLMATKSKPSSDLMTIMHM